MHARPDGGFGVYVHLPWCRRKCPYCDFNVYVARRIPEREYAHALERELTHYARSAPFAGRALRTVFFGGGTPSLLAPATIARILGHVTALWSDAVEEVSLEANPGTVGPRELRELRKAGVTRLSLGVQSFRDPVLRALVRDHDADDARRAVREAREAGFGNVNVDLIFGVPGQTRTDWERDLREAVDLGATGISAYGLTYEEGTAFHRMRASGRLAPMPEEEEVEMFLLAKSFLEAEGFVHYELSNYARPGMECRHNLAYWLGVDYLGTGCGAHSFAATAGWGRRWSNERHPDRYMAAVAHRGHARVFEEHLSREQAQGEAAFLALRTAAGLREAPFAARFGEPPQQALPALRTLQRGGLVDRTARGWRLTVRGQLLSDSVFAELMP